MLQEFDKMCIIPVDPSIQREPPSTFIVETPDWRKHALIGGWLWKMGVAGGGRQFWKPPGPMKMVLRPFVEWEGNLYALVIGRAAAVDGAKLCGRLWFVSRRIC
jgi:hypothetical protein